MECSMRMEAVEYGRDLPPLPFCISIAHFGGCWEKKKEKIATSKSEQSRERFQVKWLSFSINENTPSSGLTSQETAKCRHLSFQNIVELFLNWRCDWLEVQLATSPRTNDRRYLQKHLLKETGYKECSNKHCQAELSFVLHIKLC